MYYRPQGYRYPQNIRVPINYSGNAFSEDDSNTEKEPDTDSENFVENSIITNENESQTEDTSNEPEATSTIGEAKSTPASLFGSAFDKIGAEELLILALVFLLSDNDSENDIIWLLLLLLFIK
jgi:hypothetical protein